MNAHSLDFNDPPPDGPWFVVLLTLSAAIGAMWLVSFAMRAWHG